MSASECFHQLAEPRVGHHRQVRAGMSRVGRGTTTAFEHDDAFAGLREEVGGGETGDTAADDDHIGLGVVGELGKLRKRGGRRPVRGGVNLCGSHRYPLNVLSRHAAHAQVSIPATSVDAGKTASQTIEAIARNSPCQF